MLMKSPLTREDDLRLQSLGMAMQMAHAKGKPTALNFEELTKEAEKIHGWLIQDAPNGLRRDEREALAVFVDWVAANAFDEYLLSGFEKSAEFLEKITAARAVLFRDE